MDLNYRSCRTSIPRKRRGKHTHTHTLGQQWGAKAKFRQPRSQFVLPTLKPSIIKMALFPNNNESTFTVQIILSQKDFLETVLFGTQANTKTFTKCDKLEKFAQASRRFLKEGR